MISSLPWTPPPPPSCPQPLSSPSLAIVSLSLSSHFCFPVLPPPSPSLWLFSLFRSCPSPHTISSRLLLFHSNPLLPSVNPPAPPPSLPPSLPPLHPLCITFLPPAPQLTTHTSRCTCTLSSVPGQRLGTPLSPALHTSLYIIDAQSVYLDVCVRVHMHAVMAIWCLPQGGRRRERRGQRG